MVHRRRIVGQLGACSSVLGSDAMPADFGPREKIDDHIFNIIWGTFLCRLHLDS